MKQVWQSNDGKIFATMEECQQHEDTVGKYKNLLNLFQIHEDKLLRDYIAEDIGSTEWTDFVFNNFEEICKIMNGETK